MKKRFLLFVLGLSLVAGGCGADASPTGNGEETQEISESEKETQVLSESEKETQVLAEETQDTRHEESFAIIKQNGFAGEYSMLSFRIDGSGVKDLGDCYEVEAEFAKPVSIPADLKEGDEYSFIANELTGEKKTLRYLAEGNLTEDSTGQVYYYSLDEKSDRVMLYTDSDDRVDAPFYEGVLRIRKDAVQEIAIIQESKQVTPEMFSEELWFNGVVFDENGYVTRLVFFGD